MWWFLLGLFCGAILGIFTLALFRGSHSNDTKNSNSENESDIDENDTDDQYLLRYFDRLSA